MSRLASRAGGLVLRWAAFYTRDLDPRIARERVDELTSDLWEQHEAASATGASRIRLAASVLGRLVRGVPDDLAWRRARLGAVAERGSPFARWERSGLAGLALLVGLCLVAVGAFATVRLAVDVVRWGEVVYPAASATVVVAFVACVVGTGLMLRPRTRWLAAMWLAAGGAALMSAVLPALVATSATVSSAVYNAFGQDSYAITTGAMPWLAGGLAATYLLLALVWMPPSAGAASRADDAGSPA